MAKQGGLDLGSFHLRVPVKIPAEVLRKKRITKTLLRYLQERAVDKAGKCRAALSE